MYGRFVHEAVIAASDKETGITIHYVDEQYDHGEPIFQARCTWSNPVTMPRSLARKVQRLEYEHFPRVIEAGGRVCKINVKNAGRRRFEYPVLVVISQRKSPVCH